ncbi:MAG: copper resistance protein B [Pseudomonadota bacterium]
MNHKKALLVAAMMTVNLAAAWAQEAEPMDHDDMSHMNHQNMSDMQDMNMEDMKMDDMEMSHDHMTNESAPAAPRDPHAYADGYDFSQFPMRHESHEIMTGALRVDRLEAVRADGNTATAYELQGWFGGSFERAVVQAEGEVDGGKLQEGRAELSWAHAIAPFWDAQLGVRYDHGVDPERGWLAFGVQGLAPYWFETSVTLYVGDAGRTALRVEADYELLITQKLIVQPRIEANLYGKRDAERELGSGLSDLAAGIRLRYEIRREFAPYIGVEWAGKYGGTADHARAAGEAAKETRAVAGLRLWF